MEIHALVQQASKPNRSLGPWAFTTPSHTLPKGQGFRGQFHYLTLDLSGVVKNHS